MPDPNNSEAREIVAPPLAKVGDALSAGNWNKFHRAVFNPLRGVNGGRQVEYGVLPLALFKMIVVSNDNGNYVTCAFWDSASQTAGMDMIPVSKPYILQQAPLDGITDSNGILYTFTGIDALTALDTGSSVSEDWVINFPYTPGELLLVAADINGGIDNLYPLDFEDMNNGGKMWAKVPT